jgi:16S rRNA G966 N2-methylase RsmD
VKTKVLNLTEGHRIIQGDCLDVLKQYPDDSVDLVFTSPPYLSQRSYSIDFNLKCDEWVPWALERYLECCRISRGLVAWVIEGNTKNYTYQPSPFLLMAELHKRGIKLRKPVVFHRVGIPGSGGPDWLRNDWEPIICASKGKLPWSDNTACGHEPKYGPGGAPSNRRFDGSRVSNDKTTRPITGGLEPQLQSAIDGDTEMPPGTRLMLLPRGDGTMRRKLYIPPAKANPGNVIHCHGGGGHLGSPIAHENEAPFPEKLADFFIKSFCPPGGVVLDPFGGSGTTLASAVSNGRIAHCIDIRESQYELMSRRYAEAKSRKPSNTEESSQVCEPKAQE